MATQKGIDHLTGAAAYWAKPFKVRLTTSNFSGTFMFDTWHEARAYLAGQVMRIGRFEHAYPREHIDFAQTRLTIAHTGREYDLDDLGLAYAWRGHNVTPVCERDLRNAAGVEAPREEGLRYREGDIGE